MASRYQGITLEIGGDSTKLSKALKEPQKEASNLQRQINEVNKALKLDPGNTDLIAQKHRLLSEAVENTKSKLSLLKQAQQDFIANGGDINTQGYVQLQTEIVKTEEKLKSLTKQQYGFSPTVEAMSKRIDDFGNKATEMGNKMKTASTIATGGLVLMAKGATDFETAFVGVKKTIDGTPEQLEKIRKGILDMSLVTASSAVDIAAVAEAAGQLGIATEDIIDFTEVMVMLGDTTNLSAEEAASALAKFANITNMSASDYGRLGSVIVDLGNNFATTESDIVAMGTKLASTGELAGLSEPQIMALATAMSSVGIEAEAGGSAMSKLLKSIQVAVETGSPKLKEFAGAAGMSSSEFKKAFEQDAVGALSAFVGGLNDTERNGKSAIALLDEMGITEVRLSNTVLSLANSHSVMTDAIDTANTAWDENTALQAEADQKYQSTGAKLEQLKNSFTLLAVSLGELLLPIIGAISDALIEFNKWLSDLDPTMKGIIVTIIGIIAAAAPVLIVVGKIANGISAIIDVAGKMSGVISKLGGVIKTVFGAIKTVVLGVLNAIIAHPIIAAVAAVIAIVVLLYTKCEWFRDGVHNIINSVIQFFSNLWTNITNFLQGIIDFISENWQGLLLLLVNPIAGAFKLLYDNCEWFREAVDDFVQGIITFFTNLKDDIVQKFNDVVAFLASIPSRIKAAIAGAIDAVRRWGSDLVAKGKTAASDLVKIVVEGVKSLPGKLVELGANLVTGLWDGIASGIGWLGDQLSGFCGWVVDSVAGAFGIHSPSRVFRDQIGKWLPPGIAVGFKAEMPDAQKEIEANIARMTNSLHGAVELEAIKNTAVQVQSENTNDNLTNQMFTMFESMMEMMLNKLVMEHTTVIGGKVVQRELLPLVNKGLALQNKRGERQ